MTDDTRRLFARLYEGVPTEIPGHVPDIRIRGSTVKVICSCGQKLGGGRGCNRSGMGYVIGWAALEYGRHTAVGERLGRR